MNGNLLFFHEETKVVSNLGLTSHFLLKPTVQKRRPGKGCSMFLEMKGINSMAGISKGQF